MVSGFARDFPILQREFYGKQLVYLDSAATTQKPQSVIDAVANYYINTNANAHRGIYALSEEATKNYEQARIAVRDFINAKSQDEIVFTRGTTESINLLAHCFGSLMINKDDEIIISTMEHHSNIVPWQMLCERAGALLKVIPIDDNGVLDLDAYKNMLSPKVKLVSVVHVSNVMGIVNPVEEIIKYAKQYDIPVLLDGAQALPHIKVDVQQLGCDFYVFSAHKMYGPTGFGGLYAKNPWLIKLPPFHGGGDMIRQVSFEKTEYNIPPYKFEAGTPNMAGAAGMRAAIEYLTNIGFDKIHQQERECYKYAVDALSTLPGLRIIGSALQQISVISFVVDSVHPHDLATILDQEAIAIRAGHHCAMPLMKRLKLAATARMSLGIYNTADDIDRLVVGIEKAIALFAG